jgi:hypothetical protein
MLPSRAFAIPETTYSSRLLYERLNVMPLGAGPLGGSDQGDPIADLVSGSKALCPTL